MHIYICLSGINCKHIYMYCSNLYVYIYIYMWVSINTNKMSLQSTKLFCTEPVSHPMCTKNGSQLPGPYSWQTIAYIYIYTVYIYIYIPCVSHSKNDVNHWGWHFDRHPPIRIARQVHIVSQKTRKFLDCAGSVIWWVYIYIYTFFTYINIYIYQSSIFRREWWWAILSATHCKWN